MTERRVGIYVHFPFCKKKCVYCDFFSTVNSDARAEYIEELKREIRLFSERTGENVIADTVYFGGGTPSAVSFSDLKSVADAIYDNFDCKIKEFTVEVNPCSSEEFERYREFGATRISFGVQSLNNEVLGFLGRLHDRDGALDALERAKSSGYNVSADLMLGIPRETKEDIRSFITEIAPLVEHVSAYILKVEEGTELSKRVKRGEVSMPSDEEVETDYFSASARLREEGFERYEISNFAKRGRESLHNLKYWRGEEYLGFGASAHSFFGGKRFYNPPDLKAYTAGEHFGNYREIAEEPSSLTSEEEYIMLRTRLSEGVNLEDYARKFGSDFLEVYGAKIDRLKDFVEITCGTLRIKPDKVLLQNAILAELLA